VPDIFSDFNSIWILSADSYEILQYQISQKSVQNEVGGACSANGGEERRVQGFGEET